MKRFLTLALTVLLIAFGLSSCGSGSSSGEDADIVFINDSDATISAVLAKFQDRSGGTQNADSSPLRRGESFGFEAGEYPATIAVYETPPEPFSDIGPEALASTVISKAPPEGERWYVRVWDGKGGLAFTVTTQWPEEVPEAVTGGGVWFPSGALLLGVFLVLPLVVLAALCVVTLNNLPPQRRKGLFALFFTVLGLAAVLFGGAWILGENDLVWRTWFQELLSLALWLLGLAAGVMTVIYARRWLTERGKAVKRAATILSVCCLASAMLVGTVVGGLWSLGPAEQVGTYQGRTVVQGKWVWQESIYELYEYHGPLVRGAYSLEWSEDPFFAPW